MGVRLQSSRMIGRSSDPSNAAAQAHRKFSSLAGAAAQKGSESWSIAATIDDRQQSKARLSIAYLFRISRAGNHLLQKNMLAGAREGRFAG